MTDVPAQAVIDRLLRRIAELEYQLAVAQALAAQADDEDEGSDDDAD